MAAYSEVALALTDPALEFLLLLMSQSKVHCTVDSESCQLCNFTSLRKIFTNLMPKISIGLLFLHLADILHYIYLPGKINPKEQEKQTFYIHGACTTLFFLFVNRIKHVSNFWVSQLEVILHKKSLELSVLKWMILQKHQSFCFKA